jgi:hypothetical protein
MLVATFKTVTAGMVGVLLTRRRDFNILVS